MVNENAVWKPADSPFQPFREFWYPLGLVDEAAMHLVLANAAIHLSVLRGQGSEDAGAVVHYLSAIKSVNRRLGSLGTFDAGTADGVMGAILGVCCCVPLITYDFWLICATVHVLRCKFLVASLLVRQF